MEGYQLGGGRGRMGKWCRNKKHNWYEQNRKGDVKNSVGNGEAKELTHTTHGHELRAGGIAGRKMGTRWRGAEGENWDNCNLSLIHISEPTRLS